MVEYLKKAKNIIPKIFNVSKVSSKPIQIDAGAQHNSPIVDVFVNTK